MGVKSHRSVPRRRNNGGVQKRRAGIKLGAKMPAFFFVVLAAALSAWANLGQAHAHSGEIHLAGLSSGASWAVLIVVCGICALFLGAFMWKWRQSASETSETVEDPQGVSNDHGGGG